MAARATRKTGLRGLRSIAYDALERTSVRAQASAAATALDRIGCARAHQLGLHSFVSKSSL
jgi:hypothetical protein